MFIISEFYTLCIIDYYFNNYNTNKICICLCGSLFGTPLKVLFTEIYREHYFQKFRIYPLSFLIFVKYFVHCIKDLIIWMYVKEWKITTNYKKRTIGKIVNENEKLIVEQESIKNTGKKFDRNIRFWTRNQ